MASGKPLDPPPKTKSPIGPPVDPPPDDWLSTVRFYEKMNTRAIKVSRFFEMVRIIERNRLWPSVQAHLPVTSNRRDVRIEVDTLLLNAVKLALFEHGSDRLPEDEKAPLKSAMRCAERHDGADKADNAKSEKEQREAIEAQQKAEKEAAEKKKQGGG